MDRALADNLREDLDTKLVLLTGPRQCGKTTLARMLYERHEYFNHDRAADRLAIKNTQWRRNVDLVVFDELHKMRKWKTWVKGIYDTEGCRPRLLVTGSAKLDTARKVGDSLAGRFFQHRLHPFDVKEVKAAMTPDEALDRLLRVGGFPEPFLRGAETFYKRWRLSHLDIILRQDLIDMDSVRDIMAVETLVELLRHRVGSTVSCNSLARDLERDPKTVKRWLTLLELLYVVFKVTPFHRNVARSLLKEPKYYFYDAAQVLTGNGPRLENIVASALLKELQRLTDQSGERTDLHYLRTKDVREIDFAVLANGKVTDLIEVKWADAKPSKNFSHFQPYFGAATCTQLVRELPREYATNSGISVRHAARWLGELSILAA